MRLHIRINNNNYYDIGLRNGCKTDKLTRRFGEYQPKYLEDFIEKYNKKKINIISYGDLFSEKEAIDKLLE